MVTPVGSGKEIPVDVRIISATHKPLESLIETGQFREDLFFRLNVIPITVASLRSDPRRSLSSSITSALRTPCRETRSS